MYSFNLPICLNTESCCSSKAMGQKIKALLVLLEIWTNLQWFVVTTYWSHGIERFAPHELEFWLGCWGQAPTRNAFQAARSAWHPPILLAKRNRLWRELFNAVVSRWKKVGRFSKHSTRKVSEKGFDYQCQLHRLSKYQSRSWYAL